MPDRGSSLKHFRYMVLTRREEWTDRYKKEGIASKNYERVKRTFLIRLGDLMIVTGLIYLYCQLIRVKA
ncbi:uncharacterized protein RHIMIDRAFT_63478 [Rhizopus microsporus ATCC 52813]|uniref:Uncharacterized protein n=1 Tax=Rhizopus microsporus ATCC 52813 TaxID=1340429 RepID=A0A2G4T6D5_RHIZD|nr:uncharacterized protein RHIMIDRAFT_63478 [Rhizopus microsporus ATCC 52813]PHZ16561.1 hypothetical protein RHIMIDRAFT_63478 [Rhizopus microsporus ATCC 52813]